MDLAAQLYTLRDFTTTASGLDETLRKVAAIGYPAVQISAVAAMSGLNPEVDAASARCMLHRYELRCVATHRPWRRLVERLDEEIEMHRILGCDYLAVGSITDDFGSAPNGLLRFASAAGPVVHTLDSHGIRFGYHNHAHEFERLEGSRQTGFDALVETADPRLEFEVDTYWAMHAGVDPVGLLRRLSGRIAMVHFKDKAVVGGLPTIAAVGEGNMDWAGILGACRDGGTEWAIVEQDTCDRDPFDCLRSSYDFLRAMIQ